METKNKEVGERISKKNQGVARIKYSQGIYVNVYEDGQ